MWAMALEYYIYIYKGLGLGVRGVKLTKMNFISSISLLQPGQNGWQRNATILRGNVYHCTTGRFQRLLVSFCLF